MHVQHRTPAELARRIVMEFDELPGLRLTVWQAARMWALDHHECQAVLDALVGARLLRRSGNTYARMEH